MILLVLIASCGFSACDSGAKKLERKPKTHVRKKKKAVKGLVTVFQTPSPAEVYSLLSSDLKKLKSIKLNSSDTIADPAFNLGRMIAELSMASEKNDQYAIYRSLQQIHNLLGQLKITDLSLDSLMTQSEKVVLKKTDLQQKAVQLFPKIKELLTVSGRKSDLAALKVGAFVHQMNFILINRSSIAKSKLSDLLDLQKVTAQNLLSELVDVNGNGRNDLFKAQLERILSVFDQMNYTAQPELIYKDENGVYIISGGKELEVDQQLLVELYEIVKNFSQIPPENEDL